MNNDAKKLIDRLAREHSLSKEDYAFLVRAQDEETARVCRGRLPPVSGARSMARTFISVA